MKYFRNLLNIINSSIYFSKKNFIISFKFGFPTKINNKFVCDIWELKMVIAELKHRYELWVFGFLDVKNT